MHTNGSIIELVNVHKRFGEEQVLCGVDLHLHEGQVNVVIGESGTGKSVLLKHIIGLLRPDSGQVLYRGERIDNVSDKELANIRRNFGFLFQLGALFDSLTAGENVAFPLKERTKKPRAQIDRIARAEGRDPSDIALSTVIGMPSDPGRAVERLLELAESGVAHVILAVPGASAEERCAAIERFASEVLPVVRREAASRQDPVH